MNHTIFDDIVSGTVKSWKPHGDLAGRTDVWAENAEFHESYRGWLTTTEGPKMDEAELDRIQAQIIAAQG